MHVPPLLFVVKFLPQPYLNHISTNPPSLFIPISTILDVSIQRKEAGNKVYILWGSSETLAVSLLFSASNTSVHTHVLLPYKMFAHFVSTRITNDTAETKNVMPITDDEVNIRA